MFKARGPAGIPAGHDDHDEFGGLRRDLLATDKVLDRRGMVRLAVSASALAFLGCGGADGVTGTDAGTPTGTTGTTGTTGGSCVKIPQETAGPFPADASNGPNVLNLSGAVRSDIRSSFAGLSGTADGVALTIVLNLVSVSSCTPLPNYAVYAWHCDRPGRYSLYSSGITNQNYLRGVQVADANGRVSFTTIFPGCYAGRWPHVHFEVFQTLALATAAGAKAATSQLAFPKGQCDLVYATAGYEQSVSNLSQISLATDNVFSDGSTNQVATMVGSVASGFTATLQVPV